MKTNNIDKNLLFILEKIKSFPFSKNLFFELQYIDFENYIAIGFKEDNISSWRAYIRYSGETKKTLRTQLNKTWVALSQHYCEAKKDELNEIDKEIKKLPLELQIFHYINNEIIDPFNKNKTNENITIRLTKILRNDVAIFEIKNGLHLVREDIINLDYKWNEETKTWKNMDESLQNYKQSIFSQFCLENIIEWEKSYFFRKLYGTNKIIIKEEFENRFLHIEVDEDIYDHIKWNEILALKMELRWQNNTELLSTDYFVITKDNICHEIGKQLCVFLSSCAFTIISLDRDAFKN